MAYGQFTKERFLSKNSTKNVAWKLSFISKESFFKRNLRMFACQF